MSNPLLLSILLCLIVGTAIDTSNICVVRAAGDLAIGKPAIAISVLFASACAAIVFYLNATMGLVRHPPPWTYPGWVTLAGALLFATGALVNGACAIGTIGRLARGDIGYLATAAGAVVISFFIPRPALTSQIPDLPVLTGAPWLAILLAVTASLMIATRRHLRARRLGAYAVLGIAAGIVTNWQGNWTWLGLIQVMQIGQPIQYATLACIAAVLLGAAVTAVVTGHFRFVRPDPARMLREGAGGGLMAAGTILIPGGNDALLVSGIPSGSPHALIAYAVMFTIMLTALQMKHLLSRWMAWAGPGAPP